MESPLAAPLRHHAWATCRLLEACRPLGPAQLAATAPGTFGGILPTLRHILASEGYYRFLLGGTWPAWRWTEEAAPDLAALEPMARDCAAYWETFLREPYDPERRVHVPDPRDGRLYEVAVGVILAQVLDHGTDHRSQIATILTSIGVAPPRLDGWAYGRATGLLVPGTLRA